MDGARALISCRLEEAKDFKPQAGLSAGLDQGSSTNGARSQRAALRHLELHHRGAALYAMAGVKPADVDVVRPTRTLPAAC